MFEKEVDGNLSTFGPLSTVLTRPLQRFIMFGKAVRPGVRSLVCTECIRADGQTNEQSFIYTRWCVIWIALISGDPWCSRAWPTEPDPSGGVPNLGDLLYQQ